jgi:hypothetical protein
MENIIEVFIGMVSIIFDRMNVILSFFFFANVGSIGDKPACLPSDSKFCRYQQTNKIFLCEHRHKLQTFAKREPAPAVRIRNSYFVID